MANNNYPQITSVTSEALQAQIRTLLPSQQGFGTDLMAQNVIVPVIDLTSAAEGSSVPQNLQTALAFGSQTSFDIVNTTTVIANTTGFYRIYGVGTNYMQATVVTTIQMNLSDGLSNKIIWESSNTIPSAGGWVQTPFDFVVFLAAGESLSGTSNQTYISLVGSSRQIADVNGVLVNPSGFNPQ